MLIQKITPYQIHKAQSPILATPKKRTQEQPNFTGSSNGLQGLWNKIKTAERRLKNFTEERIARGLGKLVERKETEKLIAFTERNKFISKNLFSHLIVLGSVLLSGFYVLKTLKNENLDEKKKKTLAINQAATFVVSTVGAYKIDDLVSERIKKVEKNFKLYNKVSKTVSKAQIDNWVKGIDSAKKIIIFSTMYRFIAPVLVTPIANYLGNKINKPANSK